MDKVLAAIDKASEISGKLVSYLVWIGALMLAWEVIGRYSFQAPTAWAHGYSQRIFGSYFVMVGAFTLPLYSLGVAHCNDRLAPAQMVAASGALVLVMNFGIFLGPLAGGLSITHLGAPTLFYCLAVLQAATALLAATRLALGAQRAQEPGTALPVGHAATPVASRLNPEAQE